MRESSAVQKNLCRETSGSQIERNKILNCIENIVMIMILTAVFTITACISFRTAFNVHPDEKVHYDAVQYYQNHNLPPKFTSEEIADTFSVHGESRLTELDAYAFFAGKYVGVMSLFFQNGILIARSFNLLLLIVILLICGRLYLKQNYLFMPFLLTSQLWYLFAYINNDAWAVFLNLLFVYQLFCKTSMFHQLMDSTKEEIKEHKATAVLRILLLGLLFYFLLITKMNYMIATGICAVLYLIVYRKTCFKKENLCKLGLIILVSILCLSVRMGIDFKINGLDRLNRMEEIRISRAAEGYKPPYTQEGFKMQAQGKPLQELLHNPIFYQLTRKSFIGVYGYMSMYWPDQNYGFIYVCYGIFMLYIICKTIRDRKKEQKMWPLVLFLMAGAALFAASIYRSYTYDFQPQGRYLFPIIPVTCTLLYDQKKNRLLDIFIFIIAVVLMVMYFKYGYCMLIQ